MKVFLRIIVVFLLCPHSALAQSGWFHLTSSHELNFNPYDFYFVSSDTGFIDDRSENKSKFTNDGGITWSDSTSPLRMIFPEFQDNHTVGFSFSDFSFYRTTDGGKSWVLKTGHDTDGSNGYYSVTPKLGFFYGTLKRTTDSGNTFITLPLHHVRYIRFRDTIHGLCITEEVTSLVDDQYLWSTNNAGQTWDSIGMIKINGLETLINSLDYLPSVKQWRAELSYGMIFSHDDGLSWEIYPMPLTGSHIRYQYSFWNEHIGYALENNGIIFKTTDGGFSWGEQQTPDDFWAVINWFEMPPYAILATSETTAYALFDSVIIKTVNGGDSPASVRNTLLFNSRLLLIANPLSVSADFRFEELRESSFFEIFDFLGRSIFHVELSPGKSSLHVNMQNMSAGIYFARLGRETLRFVKI